MISSAWFSIREIAVFLVFSLWASSSCVSPAVRVLRELQGFRQVECLGRGRSGGNGVISLKEGNKEGTMIYHLLPLNKMLKFFSDVLRHSRGPRLIPNKNLPVLKSQNNMCVLKSSICHAPIGLGHPESFAFWFPVFTGTASGFPPKDCGNDGPSKNVAPAARPFVVTSALSVLLAEPDVMLLQ